MIIHIHRDWGGRRKKKGRRGKGGRMNCFQKRKEKGELVKPSYYAVDRGGEVVPGAKP